ncbi:MAG: Na+/H+ antiporter NhaC family protein [Flavobacteriales bacterium]|nr:Na+/H+ antiporter NhaC family protein [Flavobacteriales bacterium]
MRKSIVSFIFSICLIFIGANEAAAGIMQNTKSEDGRIEIIMPNIIIANIEYDIAVKMTDVRRSEVVDGFMRVTVNGMPQMIPITSVKRSQSHGISDRFFKGYSGDDFYEGIVTHKFHEQGKFSIKVADFHYKKYVNPVPLWMSLLPPLVAILMALILKEVVTALFAGIFLGTLLTSIYADGPLGFATAFFNVLDNYMLGAIYNLSHIKIMVFAFLIGSTVAIMAKNGGMLGIVDRLKPYAKDPRSTQFTTFYLGLAIFFDDYTNSLVIGNTMRSITDVMRISREKLTYLVDSTAAPIASIALITTWIGFELGEVNNGLEKIGVIDEGAYSIFLGSLPYSFYPLFTIVFIFILIYQNKDYGPMHAAETRARLTGKVSEAADDDMDGDASTELKQMSPVKGADPNMWNALIPIIVIVFGTLIGLIYTGTIAVPGVWSDDTLTLNRKLSEVIGNADSYAALLWSSISSVLVAIAMSMYKKILTLQQSIEASFTGMKVVFDALVILILAWALGLLIDDMHTADFLSENLLAFELNPMFLPTITFLLGAVISFATGTSWGTMSILYPLMLPISWELCQQAGMSYDESMNIFYNVVACVLAGAVFGDHCSPIADTTILSSLACSCNHIDHVRTQLPYALTTGVIAIVFGTLPCGFGVSPLIMLPLGVVALYFAIKFFGKDVPDIPDSVKPLEDSVTPSLES